MTKLIRIHVSYLIILIGVIGIWFLDRANIKEQRIQLTQFRQIAKSEQLARLYMQQYYLEELIPKEQKKKKSQIWLDQLNKCRKELEEFKP